MEAVNAPREETRSKFFFRLKLTWRRARSPAPSARSPPPMAQSRVRRHLFAAVAADLGGIATTESCGKAIADMIRG